MPSTFHPPTHTCPPYLQVVITPVSLLTLGGDPGTSASAQHDAAHQALGVEPGGGTYGAGMVNSDPLIMLASG